MRDTRGITDAARLALVVELRRLGLSQTEIARRIGSSQASISYSLRRAAERGLIEHESMTLSEAGRRGAAITNARRWQRSSEAA